MTDDPRCFYESPIKGQSQDYGRNQLAITVASFEQRCSDCKQASKEYPLLSVS